MLSLKTCDFPTAGLHFCNLLSLLSSASKIPGFICRRLETRSEFLLFKLQAPVNSRQKQNFFQSIQSNVMSANVPSDSVGVKIFVASLVFGCCFALVVYLCGRWQQRSGRVIPRRHSYSEKLTTRFNQVRKRKKSIHSSR